MAFITIPREGIQNLVEFMEKNHLSEWFVAKDHGAYVGATMGRDNNVLFYFSGCDPKKDEDWYDTAYSLFGGDDFGELFGIDLLKDHLKDPKIRGIKIFVTPDHISMTAIL